MSERKKKPEIKTLKDKGISIDYARFSDGREAFIFEEERFRGLAISVFRLGITDKYKVFTPKAPSMGTLSLLSKAVNDSSGSHTTIKDFEVNVTYPIECPNCKHHITDAQARYCPQCGTQIIHTYF
jgi:hypothetical protein